MQNYLNKTTKFSHNKFVWLWSVVYSLMECVDYEWFIIHRIDHYTFIRLLIWLKTLAALFGKQYEVVEVSENATASEEAVS